MTDRRNFLKAFGAAAALGAGLVPRSSLAKFSLGCIPLTR